MAITTAVCVIVDMVGVAEFDRLVFQCDMSQHHGIRAVRSREVFHLLLSGQRGKLVAFSAGNRTLFDGLMATDALVVISDHRWRSLAYFFIGVRIFFLVVTDYKCLRICQSLVTIQAGCRIGRTGFGNMVTGLAVEVR